MDSVAGCHNDIIIYINEISASQRGGNLQIELCRWIDKWQLLCSSYSGASSTMGTRNKKYKH